MSDESLPDSFDEEFGFPALNSVDVPVTLDEIGMRLSALEEAMRINSTKMDEAYKGIQWLCNMVGQGMATIQNSPMAKTMMNKFIGGGRG